MKEQIRQFWLARPPREQKILLAWAAIVIPAVIYFGLLDPLLTRIPQLQRNIPKLERELFAMRAAPSQPARGGKVEDGDLRSALFRALAARQLNADIRSLGPERAELRFPTQNIDAALNIANSLRTEARARVVSIQIKTDAPNSPVQLTMELERK
jgi:type II secretory pathway component PulM